MGSCEVQGRAFCGPCRPCRRSRSGRLAASGGQKIFGAARKIRARARASTQGAETANSRTSVDSHLCVGDLVAHGSQTAGSCDHGATAPGGSSRPRPGTDRCLTASPKHRTTRPSSSTMIGRNLVRDGWTEALETHPTDETPVEAHLWSNASPMNSRFLAHILTMTPNCQ